MESIGPDANIMKKEVKSRSKSNKKSVSKRKTTVSTAPPTVHDVKQSSNSIAQMDQAISSFEQNNPMVHRPCTFGEDSLQALSQDPKAIHSVSINQGSTFDRDGSKNIKQTPIADFKNLKKSKDKVPDETLAGKVKKAETKKERSKSAKKKRITEGVGKDDIDWSAKKLQMTNDDELNDC